MMACSVIDASVDEHRALCEVAEPLVEAYCRELGVQDDAYEAELTRVPLHQPHDGRADAAPAGARSNGDALGLDRPWPEHLHSGGADELLAVQRDEVGAGRIEAVDLEIDGHRLLLDEHQRPQVDARSELIGAGEADQDRHGRSTGPSFNRAAGGVSLGANSASGVADPHHDLLYGGPGTAQRHVDANAASIGARHDPRASDAAPAQHVDAGTLQSTGQPDPDRVAHQGVGARALQRLSERRLGARHPAQQWTVRPMSSRIERQAS